MAGVPLMALNSEQGKARLWLDLLGKSRNVSIGVFQVVEVKKQSLVFQAESHTPESEVEQAVDQRH